MPTRTGSIPLVFLVSFLILAIGGCASSGTSRGPQDRFTFVTLTSGPTSGSGTPETRQAMFKGHMANINRLAESGDLLMAGPFSKPTDPTWRGLFIMDADPERSRELVATDPGVISGEFTPLFRPIEASTTLRQSLSLYRALEAESNAAPADPSAPPMLMRPYVIIIADDARRMHHALGAANLAVVFRARFLDGNARGGLFVLDATDVAAVRAVLTDGGPCTVDGWFSSASHVRLPEAVRAEKPLNPQPQQAPSR